MRILTYTTLFPNPEYPDHANFVRKRLCELLKLGGMEARVVNPIPWFPWRHRRFGRYGALARIPAAEVQNGIPVLHPRYPHIPKFSMTAAPWLMYRGTRRVVADLRRQGFDFDVIDAHYFYPDGVAAALLAAEFQRPLVITARGTDLNLIPRHLLPRQMIRWAAGRADGLVTVCQALKDSLVELGVAPERVRVLRNGVDLDTFHPLPRDEARRALGEEVEGRIIISVGWLTRRKAHDLVIAAMPHLPGTRLLIAGQGEEEASLRALAARLGVAERVRFLGQVPHHRLKLVYSAADAMVLASSREGWANVLLECMACGTPVCASNIWGTPEVVAAPEAGLLLPERSATAIAATVTALLAAPPDRAATRAYAERFSWDETSLGLAALLGRIAGRRDTASPLPSAEPQGAR